MDVLDSLPTIRNCFAKAGFSCIDVLASEAQYTAFERDDLEMQKMFDLYFHKLGRVIAAVSHLAYTNVDNDAPTDAGRPELSEGADEEATCSQARANSSIYI